MDPAIHAAIDAAMRAYGDCPLCPIVSIPQAGSVPGGWTPLLGSMLNLTPAAGPLYRAGERMQALFSVRSGCLKTSKVDAEGVERIRGFYFPGDLIGLDSIGGQRWLSTATAVIPSQVSASPVAELRKSLWQQPALACYLAGQTSRELALAQAMSGDFTAEQRLAAFILHLQGRLNGGGSRLRLPMTRREIGDYLRMATETVSRTLKAFEQRGWLLCEERSLQLIDLGNLTALAEPVGIGATDEVFVLSI